MQVSCSASKVLVDRFILLSDTALDVPSKVSDAALELEGLLLSRPVCEEENFPVSNEVISAIQLLYERFETNLEFQFAERFLTCGSEIDEYPLYERFKRLVHAECNLANISAKDRVLFIGSGSLPISAILFSKFSGARIDCFDHSPEACDVSRRVVDKLGLSQSIQIFEVEAHDLELPTVRTPGDYGIYDVVIVALLAQPKEQILHQLWRSLGPDPRVILRYSEGNRQLLYKGMDPQNATHNNRFVLGNSHSAASDDTISTLVVKTGAQPRLFKL